MSLVTIGEHKFKIPEPEKKSDILFINDKDPYWNREKVLEDYRDIWFSYVPGKNGTKLYQDATLYNNDDVLVSLNKEDSDWIMMAYEREWRRRTYGVHFKNGKDKIEWITGDHWFTLMWAKTKRPDKVSDYFDFRYFQAEYFYLIWYVNNHPHHEGMFISKPKKTGITNLHWIYYLNKATMTKNINVGNMNIDQQKGAKTFRDHFMYAFNGLPMALQPSIKSKSETDGLIVFGERTTNSSKRMKRPHSDQELGTSVMCVPTMQNAFDVDVFSDQWYDEPPKYKSDFGEIYRSNEGATSIQNYSVGKRWLTSYTPEGEAPSFIAAKTLYYESELRTIAEGGNTTKSRIICHHIPAYASWWGAFDKHGYCNEKDAMGQIVARRNRLKGNQRELQTEIRRYANTKKESWLTGGAGTVFDNLRLSDILTDVEEEERTSPTPIFGKGRLEWKNKIWEMGGKNARPKGVFGEVEFVPLSDQDLINNVSPKCHVYEEIPVSMRNLALKFGRDEWGNLHPPPMYPGTIGGDPTQHAAASEVIEGSKNAYHYKNRQNDGVDSALKRVATHVFCIEYFDRPESPDEAYEDLAKLIIYTGGLAAVEANVPEFATRLMAEGLGRYMLVKDENGIKMPWERWMGLANEPDKKYHLLRTTGNSQETREMLETFVRLWKAYMAAVPPGQKDYGRTVKSTRLIKQLMDLDVTDTKKFDLFMSGGYCLMADEIYSSILLQEQMSRMADSGAADVISALLFRN